MPLSKTLTFSLTAIASLALLWAYAPLLILGRTQKPKDIPLRQSQDIVKKETQNFPSKPPVLKMGNGVEVYYDMNSLPAPVQKMREKLLEAAQSGAIEKLKTVFETNEMPPVFARTPERDPIFYWKKKSGDGQGKEILSVLANVLNLPAAKIKIGTPQEMIVFPYIAEMPLKTLTDEQKVDFYRILPPQDAKVMEQFGSYVYWRVGIGKDGVLHYFIEGK